MKKFLMSSAAVLSLTLTGCALSDTAIVPMGNDQYKMVSTARSERNSLQGAINKATEMCQERKKRLVVLNSKTVYQGIDKEAGAAANVALAVAATLTHTAPVSTTRSDDYKTTLTYRCQ